MAKKISPFKSWLGIFLFLTLNSGLHPQFKRIDTSDLRLIFFPAESFLANHVIGSFTNSLNFHEKLFGYKPTEKVNVLLHDFGDFANASAGAVPQNTIVVTIAPSSYVFEIMPAYERISTIMHHELVHILTSDMAARADRFYRSIFFGKVSPDEDNPLTMLYGYLTNPRLYVPRWYMEGMAVFMETWMSGGFGRTLGCYDEMVFRTLVKENSRIYDLVGLESAGTRVDFQVGVNSYLYGTRFYSWLALQYGPESLAKWVARPDGSSAYFSTQFRKVYGQPIGLAWSQWIEFEKEFQRTNLEAVGANPLTPFRDISARALGSVSRAFHDPRRNKVYLGVNYPGQVAHLAALDLASGSLSKICDVKGPALYYVSSLAYDPGGDTLFYTTDNNSWRDLRRVDLRTGGSRLLIKDARVGDLAFNGVDKSLWGVRHYNGISTIVRIPPPYREWHQAYSWPYGRDIYDIDISPDGKTMVAALTEINGSQALIQLDVDKLMQGSAEYESLSDFENSSPANFVFAADGKTVYGSSYYSGVSNIYRCDRNQKKIEALTNIDTGFFRPVPIGPDQLLVFRYTPDGFRPALISSQRPENLAVRSIAMLGQRIADRYPVVSTWALGPATAVPVDSLITSRGGYTPTEHIGLKSAYPVLEGYKDSIGLGWNFHLADKVSLERIDLTASYSPDTSLAAKERLHLKMTVNLHNWELLATHNAADFFDLFGPTKTSRKGQSLQLGFHKNLIFDEPNRYLDYSVRAAGYFNLERMPDFQNVPTTFSRFYSLSFKLNYKYLRKSLGAIEDEKGYQYRLSLTNYYVNQTLFPRLNANLDFGLPMPLPHSSLWIRGAAGYAFGDRSQPFANFYFGAFGNNWVDHQDYRRFQEFYSFPGIGINDVGGRNYVRLMLEGNLPPLFFRRFGFPFLYANWASVSLFSTGLATNLDSRPDRRKLLDLGIQLDLRLIALSHHQLTLSFGYAVAFERNRERSDEWMVSLKI